MHLKEGSSLQNGKFRIIRVLGQGGFGITYLAENTYFDRRVAIKEFFPKDFCGRDSTSHLTLGTQNTAETVARLKARFLKEAKNIAALDAPGIVRIHDIFEENDTAYYVMEYIEGTNLNDMVKHSGPMSEPQAIGYTSKVADAVEYIHARHMTHFDIKPANIVVRKSDNQPILIDFGLSKQYDNHGDATSTLMQGVSQGYSPIELYNAGAITSFSPQTDVYSIAATLYFLLTGKVPPAASQIVEDGIRLPASLSEPIKNAIKKAMQPGRSKRTQSVADFIADLHAAPADHAPADEEDTVLIAPPAENVIDTPLPPAPVAEKKKSHSALILGGIMLAIISVLVGISVMSDGDHAAVAEEDDWADSCVVEEVEAVEVEAAYDEFADSAAWDLDLSPIGAEQVYNIAMVDQQPEFPGGVQAMYAWLQNHINYPPVAAEEGVQGKVIIEFVVSKTGAIENVRVLRGRHAALDKEAIRVVKAMPKWNPGRNNGRPVSVTYTLPITFVPTPVVTTLPSIFLEGFDMDSLIRATRPDGR